MRKFAWVPTIVAVNVDGRIGNGKIAWLRNYSKVYEYKNVQRYASGKWYNCEDWDLIDKL